MDKRWRNLGILLVVIVLIFVVLNFNIFIKLPLSPSGSDNNVVGLDANEKMFLKISNVFTKNDVNIQEIRYLDNIQYNNDVLLFSSTDSDLIKAKNELLAIEASSETSDEGKSVANIYSKAIDFVLFEKQLTQQLKTLENLSSSISCNNISLMADANQLISQRYDRILELYDLVQEHSLNYDWTSEVIVIDIDREETSKLMFVDEANAFIESCSGDSN